MRARTVGLVPVTAVSRPVPPFTLKIETSFEPVLPTNTYSPEGSMLMVEGDRAGVTTGSVNVPSEESCPSIWLTLNIETLPPELATYAYVPAGWMTMALGPVPVTAVPGFASGPGVRAMG